MDSTRASLLERVKGVHNETAWREFFAIYAPMIERFARSRGLRDAEAEDVAQACLERLSQSMTNFDYEKDKGSFKNYVFTLTRNEIASRLRKKQLQQAVSGELRAAQAPPDELEKQWDRHWMTEHLVYCLNRLEGEFSQESIDAFKLYALSEWPVEKVCASLNITANQVYLAKSRILRRLRSELTGLIGDVL